VARNKERHEAALRGLIDEARRNGESRSAARRHHLVPEFYLKHWADDGKIRVTNVDESRSWVTTPNKAAFETDYYRVESPDIDPDEVPPLLFETALSKIEQWGAVFINAAVTNHDVGVDDEERVLFSLYMAMQYVRGRHFRAVARASATDYFKLKYGQITEKGIQHVLRERGLKVNEANMSRFRRFVDSLNSEDLALSPTKASLLGLSGRMVSDIGSYLFERGWHIYSVPPILVTCDEPVIPVPGPPHPRGERGGVADAGVVLFPLTPSLLLAMFDGESAYPQRPYQLDYADLADINREIVGASSAYAFERPARRTAVALKVPEAREPISRTIASVGQEADQYLIRRHRPSRWVNASPAPPWPVQRWFAGQD